MQLRQYYLFLQDVCNGKGQCVCGQCQCVNPGPYFGTYCELCSGDPVCQRDTCDLDRATATYPSPLQSSLTHSCAWATNSQKPSVVSYRSWHCPAFTVTSRNTHHTVTCTGPSIHLKTCKVMCKTNLERYVRKHTNVCVVHSILSMILTCQHLV